MYTKYKVQQLKCLVVYINAEMAKTGYGHTVKSQHHKLSTESPTEVEQK